jgi:oxygen-dependent protoporphyrinogen oxidase
LRIVVVGGGISGLAAAWEARAAGAEVTVLEASPRAGGVLAVSDVAGVSLDSGAESFLARVPEAAALAAELGLPVVHPARVPAALWIGGALRPLPGRTVMGVPTSAAGLRPVVGWPGVARFAWDAARGRRGGRPPGAAPLPDVAVGALVARRLGRRTATRLVDPLLGGVYAGRSELLSLRATVPALAAARDRVGDHSLVAAARAALPVGAAPDAPVFGAPVGGMGSLATALAARLDVRTGQAVVGLFRSATGWDVVVRSADGERTEQADGVVVAVPAHVAARLLAEHVPGGPGAFGAFPAASVALASFAFPQAAVPRGLAGSGFLVPADQGRLLKAATFSSQKWPHLAAAAPGLWLARASAGRYLDQPGPGGRTGIDRDDRELAGVLAGELRAATGLRGRPVDVRVTRWDRGLPQYLPGHVDTVARLRRGLPPGVALVGAAYDGVGVPACIRSARTHARTLLAALSAAGTGGGPAVAPGAAEGH